MTPPSQRRFQTAVGLALVCAVAAAVTWDFRGVITRLEAIAYDVRLRASAPGGIDERVVIVDIDEKSLAAEGRWPWRRDKLAALVDALFDRHAVKLVGFDVTFAEADTSSGYGVLDALSKQELASVPGFADALERLRPALDYDARFARSLRGRPVVLGYALFTERAPQSTTRSGALPPPLFAASTLPSSRVNVDEASGYLANLPALQTSAAGGGHLRYQVDLDGVVRRAPLVARIDGAYYEALSLALARRALADSRVQPLVSGTAQGPNDVLSIDALRVGKQRIALDASARALIPFRGAVGSFRYVAATDVLRGTLDAHALRDKIVLVGTTATGIVDDRATPLGSAFPGVEIHAHLIAGILDGRFKSEPYWSTALNLGLVLALGGWLAWWLPQRGPSRASLAVVLLIAALVSMALYAWYRHDLVLPLATPLLLIAMLYVLRLGVGFFLETRRRRQLASVFGHYVPPELARELSAQSESTLATLRGESRELTVLFCDIRGFTRISEGMAPAELVKLMNTYFTAMTEVIHAHRGTIDKYIGDAIMCFWGAPVNDAQHAEHAIEAALAMKQRVAELAPQLEARGWPRLAVGIGINTGTVNVGDMGSRFRRSYTVMGDAVNLASRLEGLNSQYGVDVLVSDTTRARAPRFVYRELDRVRVQGKANAVTICEPLGLDGDVPTPLALEAAAFADALVAYRARRWDEAVRRFGDLARDHPQARLYAMYLERIEALRETPPADDWDGVYAFERK